MSDFSRLLTVLVLICGMQLPCYAAINVTFLVPDFKEDKFWGKMTSFMQAAANDLNIQLEVIYNTRRGNTNRFYYQKTAEQVINRSTPPDYLIFVNLKDVGHRILQQAEVAKVKTFIVTSEIPDDERNHFQKPRGKFKYWLGLIAPDEINAGYRLGQSLINQALIHNQQQPIHAFAIGGSFNSATTHQRERGLKQALQQHPSIHLLKTFHSHTWNQKEAYQKTKIMLNRHPQTKIIWTAGDDMALGAYQAVAERKLKQKVFIGGIDWTDNALNSVLKNQLSASVGGHFTEAGLLLVLIYDYHHGIDFVVELGTEIKTPMQLVDKNNVNALLTILSSNQFDQINFQQLTKKLNPSRKKYELNTLNVLKEIMNAPH